MTNGTATIDRDTSRDAQIRAELDRMAPKLANVGDLVTLADVAVVADSVPPSLLDRLLRMLTAASIDGLFEGARAEAHEHGDATSQYLSRLTHATS